MMIRTCIVSLGAALLLVGCNKAADEQKKADQAQAEADKKIDEASEEAAEKINAAQTAADEKIAEARADFEKLRADYRREVTRDLIPIDKQISDLESQARTAKAKTKAQLDSTLPEIHKLRENVADEYRSLELASAVTWDDAKARVDRAVDALKKAIDKAD